MKMLQNKQLSNIIMCTRESNATYNNTTNKTRMLHTASTQTLTYERNSSKQVIQ